MMSANHQLPYMTWHTKQHAGIYSTSHTLTGIYFYLSNKVFMTLFLVNNFKQLKHYKMFSTCAKCFENDISQNFVSKRLYFFLHFYFDLVSLY